MVIGRGLIAKAFEQYQTNEEVIIFASGVSNSKCTNEDEFNRELNLINEHRNNNKLFIYFSTISIFDPSLKQRAYVKHKLACEKLITEHFNNYLICRLPNVVGPSNNPNTMINYFTSCIKNNQKIEIQKNAYRYLIHIDDVFNAVHHFLSKNEQENEIVNISHSQPFSVSNIVTELQKKLNKNGETTVIAGGSKYEIPNLDNDFSAFITKKSLEDILA